MLRLTLKNLWAHKVRLALTGVAVVLGVAFMTGTMVLTDTMGHTFDDMLATTNAGTDVVIQQPETVDAEMGDVRERVPAETLDVIRGVDGVETAAGSIQGFAQLVKADGTVGSLDGLGATIGTNWVDDEQLNPLSLASGRAPTAAGEVVLDRNTVEAEGWTLGDEITVMAKGQPERLTLVGTASFGDVGGLPGSSLVAVSDAEAQRMFAEPGAYDLVAVDAADGVDDAELASSIDRALGTGRFDVQTGEADTATKQDQLRSDLSFFNTFLMAFAYVSLFVGTFIIYNTFSILVAQRSKDMAMLRAIGAGRRQLLRSLLAESAVVGLIASVVGLGVGVLMSFALKALLASVGLEIPSGPAVITTGTIVTAFVVGVTVTVVSALAPAVRASRVRPIAALRDVAVDHSAVSRTRTALGLVLGGAGTALFAAAIAGSPDDAPPLAGLGAVAIFIGVFVLGPVIGRPLVRLMGWPVARTTGVTGSLARENATRSPKRTAATASALMVGVALVGFITILAASTKASIDRSVDRSFRADYVIESGAWGEGGFTPALAGDVAAAPGVESVTGLRNTTVEAFDGSTDLQATDMSAIDGLYDLGVTAGSLADVGEGEVAVTTSTAEAHRLTVGDTVSVSFPRTGDVALTVAAIYETRIDSDYLVDLSTFEANVTDQFDTRIFVGTADGVDAATTRAAIEQVLDAFPNAELQDQAQFKEGITSEIDRMLNLIYGLLALAVVIALLGIANTLALSIHERRREIGLLRAVGTTRGQIRRMVRWEAMLIALLGTALGIGLAVGGAWGMITAVAEQDITTFVVPGTQLAVIVAMAGAAGVLAAVGPARRAARLDVLDAISSS